MASAQQPLVYTSSHVYNNSTLVEILDDLCVRFVLNLPEEELNSVERICFQIEEAQWYYEDFVRGHNTSLPTLNLRQFAAKIFQHCPSLQEWKDSHEQALNQFIAYKTRVPVRGAILLNHALDQCVLVRGMKSSASWSFPRGKINQDEMDEICAVREVLEETGFDASELINAQWYIESTMRSQNIRLYIIPGVPMDTAFAPRTRNEIGTIQWHPLSDLPTFAQYNKRKANPVDAPKMGKFYMVAPFLPQLRKWIQQEGYRWQRSLGPLPPQTLAGKLSTDDEQEQDGVVIDELADGMERQSASSDNDENAENTPPFDDSAAHLRSLLGIHAEAQEPPPIVQPDTAAKLKYILSIGGKSEPAPPPPPQPANLAANSQLLLSMLQNNSSNISNAKTPPPLRKGGNGPYITQSPGTPTRIPASSQANASHLQSPNLAPGRRQPLSPLYDAPSQQQPLTYAADPIGLNTGSQSQPPATAAARTAEPYSSSSIPVNALFSNLQAHAKPAMTEQASALLATLKSGNLPQTQQQQPQLVKGQPIAPLDPQVAAQGSKSPDTQQKLSLLSILKGGAPTPGPDASNPPPAPQPQPQISRKPVPQPQIPQVQQLPKTAPVQQMQQIQPQPPQHPITPISPPRGPRQARAPRNQNGGRPVSFDRAQTYPSQPIKDVPAPIQTQSRQQTAPVEPYLNSPIAVNSGMAASNGPPTLARHDSAPFDRRETTNQQQQQTLLAMFKKPSAPTITTEGVSQSNSGIISPTADRLAAAVKKVQAGKLPAMKTGGVSLGGGSSSGQVGLINGQAPPAQPQQGQQRQPHIPGGAATFAKDAFLMSYLEGVAKGAGK